MYKLSFFVPEADLEKAKCAIFAAGAGKIGDYDQCCWQTKGIGQFCPLAGSTPHIGQQDTLNQLEEWKVEMVCEDQFIELAISALKDVHPYEEVAYDVIRLEAL